MKIAYVVSLFPCWSETFILREIIELRKRGAEINIFSLKTAREKLVHEEAKFLLDKVFYPSSVLEIMSSQIYFIIKSPLQYLTLLFSIIGKCFLAPAILVKTVAAFMIGVRFSRIISKGGFQHIHAHWATYSATCARVISRLTGVSYSFTAHSHDIYFRNPMLEDNINSAEFVVTISEYNERFLFNKFPALDRNKIRVVRCGVYVDKEMSRKVPLRREPVLLSVGRLSPEKGFNYLIEACRMLRDKGYKFKTLIVGEGPLKKKLRALVKKYDLSQSVVFTGSLSQGEIRALFMESSLFVLPSLSEGIPVSLMEALSFGVPAIATSITAVPELVMHNNTGILVPAGDAERLAESIEVLLNDSELAERIGRGGRALVEREYNVVENARKLYQLFERTIAGKRKINVMYVIDSLDVAGAENVLVSFVKEMDRTVFSPVVCCMDWRGALAEYLERENIKVVEVKKRRGVDIFALLRLIRIIKREKADIVHTHLWTSDFWGRIAAKLAGVPVIVSTAHNVDTWKPKSFLVADRILASFTDKIIAVSDNVKSFYVNCAGIPDDKIQRIYNGIDINKFNVDVDVDRKRRELGLVKGKRVIAVIGRLVEQKGHIYFLECFRRLQRMYSDIQGLIVGDGPLRGILEEKSRELGLSGSVVFTGIRNDIPEILNIIDVLAVPSLYEGLPTIILEAMAAGVPVVATNVGGNAEIVIDGETGFIVPPKDAGALAGHIGNILGNSELKEYMRKVSKERVSRLFSLDAMLKEVKGVYRSLMEDRFAGVCNDAHVYSNV